jgi:MtN3 and saliva related transmembrane protein
MEIIEILGLVAASLTTGCFVPQVYKTWKNKSTKDISLIMYLFLLGGVLVWIIYGVYHKSLPIVFCNILTGILVIIMIYLKLKHK